MHLRPRLRHYENSAPQKLRQKTAKLRLPMQSIRPNKLVAMKKLFAIALFAVTPVYAGTSAKTHVPPPPADPCLFTWFVGGSVGYLTEFEEVMYTLHVGTDTCWNVGGWNIALFAEIGYTEKEESYRRGTNNPTNYPALVNGGSYSLGQMETILDGLSILAPAGSSYSLDIMPITANIKFERPLTDSLNVYVGAGLGMARVDIDARMPIATFSDEDWVFVGQVFAGLVYNVNPSFEIFGGARWMYYDDADFTSGPFSGTLEMDDDFLFEIGARYNF
jgi:opacity protein-like surface antigen